MGWPAALAGAVGGLSVGTTLISSLAQYQQGQYASEVAGREAKAYDIQARQVQQQAGQQIGIQDYKAAHLLSRIITSAAGSGVTEEGSPSVQFATSAEEAEVNDMYTKYAANVQASSLEYQGVLTRAAGSQEESAATLGAITSGITGTISSGIEAYGLQTKTDPYGFNTYSDPLGGNV